MISFPFFQMFTVEAREFAATLAYRKDRRVWYKGGGTDPIKGYMCPLGACCYYDSLLPPITMSNGMGDLYLPLPSQVAPLLGVTKSEVNDFITLWDRGEILQEELLMVMGVTANG